MINIKDVYSSFVGSLPITVKMLRMHCQVRSLEIQPKPDSLLYIPSAPEATLRLPLDHVIAPTVVVGHAWDTECITMASKLISDRAGRALLVDVGANVGLFSRQMLNHCPAIRRAFLYEPHPENFACLIHNLAPFKGLKANNFALGTEAGEMAFHMDRDNAGNYSLNPAAIEPDVAVEPIRVSVRAAGEEAQSWLKSGLPIFYKSDTQGHDELIATAIGSAVWDRVIGGVFELWRIAKPTWSAEALRALLDSFPHKRFTQNPGDPLSTDDVFAYLVGNEGASRDLIFWR